MVILIIVISLISCSPKPGKSVLTFFFDGVPVNDTLKPVNIAYTLNDTNSAELFRSDLVAVNEGYLVHNPYKEKECLSCHSENSKSELILPQPQLCYTCHEDFLKVYKKVHGPVVTGYCTSCHNAHMSKEKKLLIRTGQQLCFYCHESEVVMRNEVHKDIGDSECTICHNPHGGDDRFILN